MLEQRCATTTTTNVMDYTAAITQLRVHFTKSRYKTVAQLNADVCWPSEYTAPCQPYDWRKRWDLVSLRNVKSEEQAWVSSGRLFHARAAATGKAWSPRVARRVDGTCSVMVMVSEQRHRRATISMSATGCQTGMPVLCHAHNGMPEHKPELDSLWDTRPVKLP